MRFWIFSKRTAREILRDPLTAAFSLGFPLAILLLFTAIQANVPVSIYEIEVITPGIAVFGLSFLTLFSATLLSKDRTGAFLQRLFTTPLTAADYILGYTLPLVPIAVLQCAVCFGAAILLGLPVSVHILSTLLFIIPVSLFFISLGLLCGTVFSDKQVGGICGALLTNLAGFLSGVWFDLDLIGGAFKQVAYALPFVHATEMEKAVLAGNYAGIFPHLWWVLGYMVLTGAAAVFLFTRKMKES